MDRLIGSIIIDRLEIGDGRSDFVRIDVGDRRHAFVGTHEIDQALVHLLAGIFLPVVDGFVFIEFCEGLFERLLDVLDDAIGKEQGGAHTNRQPDESLGQGTAEFLEVLTKGHGAFFEEIVRFLTGCLGRG